MTKRIKCPRCKGNNDCEMCDGQGEIALEDGNEICFLCKGIGFLSCNECKGKGSFTCEKCTYEYVVKYKTFLQKIGIMPGTLVPVAGNNKVKECNHCGSTGIIKCNNCNGCGQCRCNKCGGSGISKIENLKRY